MDRQEVIELLKNAHRWNQYREANPNWIPDVPNVYLCGKYLNEINLRSANLKGVTFYDCTITDADFSNANLSGAKFVSTDLRGAIFDKQQIAMLPELLGIKVIEDKQ
jgi:hypothetical protein